jgi:P27 family predicted phage terminase small subunit
MRGRKQTSIEVKGLAGTLRPDRMKTGLPYDMITICPEPPSWLNSKGKDIFSDTCQLLIDKHLLYNSDVHLMAIFAHELWTYETAVSKLKTASKHVIVTKTGYSQPSPWIAIRNQAQKNIIAIGSLFGFDPLSRMRFDENQTEKEDELQKLLEEFK